MTATSHRFTERAVAPIGRVDKAAGVIHDVRIIGTKSRNRRTYTHDALQTAVGKYEGVHVNVNHPKSSELNEDRQFDDWAGVLRNVAYRDGALYGDLHLRRASRWFDQIVEAATEFPNSFGLSHVADGDSRFDRGEEIVESIDNVFSVDIVLAPATNKGLFESFDWEHGDAGASVGLGDCGDKISEVVAKMAELAATQPGVVPESLLATCVHVAGIAQGVQMMHSKALLGESQRPSFDSCHREAVRSGGTKLEAADARDASPLDFDFSQPGAFAARYR